MAADDLDQQTDAAAAEPVLTPMGVPINVYDHLDKATLVGLNEQLDADADLESFKEWLDERVASGGMRQIVADHISAWNDLKAQTSEYVAAYQAYTQRRLADWEPLGLERPQGEMFGTPTAAVSKKQPRNGRCSCGSGLKFKRCHGAS